MRRESFIMRHEMEEVFDLLTDEQVGKLTRALMAFSKHGVKTDLDPVLNIILVPMLQTLIRDNEAYEERCRKNAEAAAKRWEKTKKKTDPKKKEVIPLTTVNEREYEGFLKNPGIPSDDQ